MGCNCGKNKAGSKSILVSPTGERMQVAGWQVIWPDGTATPEDQPIFSMIEARQMIRRAGGGTAKRLLKPAS